MEVVDQVLPFPSSWEDLTFTVALLIAVVAFVREVVVPGSRVKKADEQNERLSAAMERQADAMEKSVEVNAELLKRQRR